MYDYDIMRDPELTNVRRAAINVNVNSFLVLFS